MAAKQKPIQNKSEPALPVAQLLPPAPAFPAMLVALLSLAVTALVFAPTLFVPFYISDDADSFRTTEQLLGFLREGEWLKRFEMSSTEARNFPGFWYYTALRLVVLGKSALAWHSYHLLTFAAIGVLASYVAWQVSRSCVPGLLAYALFVSTGEAVSKSNWDNMLNIMTFEPPLTLMWLSAGCLLAGAAQARALWRSMLLAIPGLILLVWSLFMKETSFLIVGAVTGFVLLVVLLRMKWGALALQRKWALFAITAIALLAATAWGIFVYTHLRKDASYGGMGTLGLTPKSMWDTYKKYQDILIGQSDYLIPLGLCLLIIRLALQKRRGWTTPDYWQLTILVAGLCQLLTLLIWPFTEGRYVQPAYLCFLVVSFGEFALLLRALPALKTGRGRTYLLCGAVLILLMLALAFLLEPATFVTVAKFILLIAGLAAAVLAYGWRPTPTHSPRACAIARFAFVAALLPCLVITLLQGLNARAYILADYALTEGMRYRLVSSMAKDSIPNAAVYWLVDNGNDGHAWAAGIYMNEFMNRSDLIVGPSTWVVTKRMPQKGDLLIPYLVNIELASSGEGTLARLDQVTGGNISAFKNSVDVRSYLTRLLFYPSTVSINDLALNYIELRVPVYRVMSDTWIPNADLKQKFFQ